MFFVKLLNYKIAGEHLEICWIERHIFYIHPQLYQVSINAKWNKLYLYCWTSHLIQFMFSVKMYCYLKIFWHSIGIPNAVGPHEVNWCQICWLVLLRFFYLSKKYDPHPQSWGFWCQIRFWRQKKYMGPQKMKKKCFSVQPIFSQPTNLTTSWGPTALDFVSGLHF